MEFLRDFVAVLFLAAVSTVACTDLPFLSFLVAVLRREKTFLLLSVLSAQMIYLWCSEEKSNDNMSAFQFWGNYPTLPWQW